MGRGFAVLLSLSVARVAAGQPLFDTHLHYDTDAAQRLPPDRIVSLLQSSDIRHAVVTGSPPAQVLTLVEAAPGRVIPALGVYREAGDKQTWMFDGDLPGRVAEQLKRGPWRAVGELHLLAARRHSPVFLRIVDMASARGLPLLMHCDPAVIDTLFERSPRARVIWAHAGSYPYPPLLRDYLDRYPQLYIDVSMRDRLLAPDGVLDPAWENLLWEYPDRFMVGVDTFSVERWTGYASHAGRIRQWLAQLPADVAERIAYRNAARVFGVAP